MQASEQPCTQAYKRRKQQVRKSGPEEEMSEGEVNDSNEILTVLLEFEQPKEAKQAIQQK